MSRSSLFTRKFPACQEGFPCPEIYPSSEVFPLSRSSFQKVYRLPRRFSLSPSSKVFPRSSVEGFLVQKFLFTRKFPACQEGFPCPEIYPSSEVFSLSRSSFQKVSPCQEGFLILESLPLAKNVFLFPRFRSFPYVQKFFPKSFPFPSRFPSPEVPIFQKVSHL